MARRPIFTNEVLSDIGGDFEPRYNITSEGKINLLNPISVQGTPQNADNMNNLFDFDNMDSMVGNTRETIFNANGSITENIKIGTVINATRLTEFVGTEIKETTTVYDDTGTVVLRKSITTTSFPADGSIKEVVS